jgi:hypothetical protein
MRQISKAQIPTSLGQYSIPAPPMVLNGSSKYSKDREILENLAKEKLELISSGLYSGTDPAILEINQSILETKARISELFLSGSTQQ